MTRSADADADTPDPHVRDWLTKISQPIADAETDDVNVKANAPVTVKCKNITYYTSLAAEFSSYG